MELSAHGYHIPIACRFVPNDQWLVTHLNPSWRISEVKQWLLAKCLPTLFTPIPPRPRSTRRRRPVSPIVFAARDTVDDENDPVVEKYYDTGQDTLENDVFSDKYMYVPPRQQTAQTAAADMIPKTNSPLPQYTLLSFSTGQILEDHYPLEWYKLYPHELLELHSHSAIIKLPRERIDAYIKPFFEARVWALRVVGKDDDGVFGSIRTPEGFARIPEVVESEKERLLKRRRTKLQWQELWVIVHQDLFQLCKDRGDPSPIHSVDLSTLVSLRGADHLHYLRGSLSGLSFASPPSSNNSTPYPGNSPTVSETRIICAKFRFENQSHADGSLSWWRRGSRDAGGEESRKNSVAGIDQLSAEEEGLSIEEHSKLDDSITIVMDLPDEHTYNNLLRVLHRQEPSSSSFVPASGRRRSPRRRSYSPISFASGSVPGTPAMSPEPRPRSPSPIEPLLRTSVRYPEWRLELVRRARRAGLGDVGRAMEVTMFGTKVLHNADEEATHSMETSEVSDIEEQTRGRPRTWGVVQDSDSDTEDESSSEREWEGWEVDLCSGRARRNTSRESRIEWASSWVESHSGTSTDTPYTFPASDASLDGSIDPLQRASHHSLKSYASADSLLRRTINRATPRKRPSVPSRPESPCARARSPLASSYLDDQDLLYDGISIGHPYGQSSNLSRHPSFESSSSSPPGRPTISRSFPLGMSMTPMSTTVTTTVSVGVAPHHKDRKGKVKAKSNKATGIPAPKPVARQRSSTIQAPSSPPSFSGISRGQTSRQPSVRQGTTTFISRPRPLQPMSPQSPVPDITHTRPGKLKLSMSFAQAAASGLNTPSSSALQVPPSANSASSFESPTFARPDDSD